MTAGPPGGRIRRAAGTPAAIPARSSRLVRGPISFSMSKSADLRAEPAAPPRSSGDARRPIISARPSSRRRSRRAAAPCPLREAAPDVPVEVADLVMRLIAHDKADRPATAQAVAAAIAALEGGLPVA